MVSQATNNTSAGNLGRQTPLVVSFGWSDRPDEYFWMQEHGVMTNTFIDMRLIDFFSTKKGSNE